MSEIWPRMLFSVDLEKVSNIERLATAFVFCSKNDNILEKLLRYIVGCYIEGRYNVICVDITAQNSSATLIYLRGKNICGGGGGVCGNKYLFHFTHSVLQNIKARVFRVGEWQTPCCHLFTPLTTNNLNIIQQ